jgi:MYXO-CTERM domain-containing protein
MPIQVVADPTKPTRLTLPVAIVPPTDTPEVSLAAAVPLLGMLVLGIGFVIRRRRTSPAV